MLIKRIEKNGEVKALYESSNILASTYKKSTKQLTVVFKRGAQYQYSDISDSDYFKFEMADSQGKVLNTSIKSKPVTQLDDTDIKTFTDEMESYREDEIQMFKVGLIDEMSRLVDAYSTEKEIAIPSLNGLVAMIDRYKEALSTKTEIV